MYEISVIVPVYNVERWLDRCVDSLINQTIFSSMEILLIDDGSTDLSGNICDLYANKYENITAFHKGNGGVSSARNFGLQKRCHNLRSTRKRGIENVEEQCLLSACALNLKRLIKGMDLIKIPSVDQARIMPDPTRDHQFLLLFFGVS